MGEPRFEDQMRRLEEIVGRIESGEVGLDDSLELCQEASGLVKALRRKLSEAELKVEELSRDAGGELKLMKEEKREGE
jgi:exodeoxyribonuclease VII small subunit